MLMLNSAQVERAPSLPLTPTSCSRGITCQGSLGVAGVLRVLPILPVLPTRTPGVPVGVHRPQVGKLQGYWGACTCKSNKISMTLVSGCHSNNHWSQDVTQLVLARMQ